MDATLTIQVRVLGAQAQQQVKALQSQINALNAQSGASAAGSVTQAGMLGRAWTSMTSSVGSAWSGLRKAWSDGTNIFGRTIKTLDRVGQSLRRSGQQITFGFTLPLVLAGSAIMGWAMDNEKAMTQVRKVYGDYTYSSERVQKETDALGKTFELLSGIFGIHQDEVIGIASEWAATGLAGEDLARATRATMEAMMLGDLDSERATKSLISIMATWRTSLDDMGGGFSELTDAMAILNAVENQTGARFDDLVEAFDRAGGAARQAGMTMQELSALVAALVPATGSGAAAGNAIKTMVSRIMAPTQETLDVLNAIGINTSDPKWMSATATQKIERMAKEFENLDQATKNVVTTTVAGRWQLNRFEVIMSDIASGTGMYAKGMDAASNAQRRQGDYLKELNAIMDSNPKKMEILTNVLRNELTTAFIQFMPIILGIVGVLGKLASAFNNLPPRTKAIIVTLITLIAVLGPVLMLIGVLTTTLKFFFEALAFGGGILKVFVYLAGGVFKILGALVGIMPTLISTMGTGMISLLNFAKLAPTAIGVAIINLGQWISLLPTAAGVMAITFGEMITTAMTWAGVMAITIGEAIGYFGTWVAVQAIGAAQSIASMGAFIGSLVGTAITATGVYAIMAAEAVQSAAVTATAWLVLAAPGVVSAVGTIGAALTALAGFIGVPVGVVVAVLVGMVAFVGALFNKTFRNAVIGAIKAIGRGIWGLPQTFARALSALLHVVATVVIKVMDWLSYLNPFQRHSPSLVDNVKAGVSTILNEYSRLRGISAAVRSAAAAHQAFQNAIAGAQGAMDAQETAKQRTAIAAQAPGAVGAFDNMVAQRSNLNSQLPALAQQIDAQSLVVGGLEASYNALDRQVTISERVLADLEHVLEGVNARIEASQDAIDKYADTGITGMRAMSDAIFENSMAQKRLQLAIMDLEDAGGTFDDLKARMAALNGEMELLTGTRQGLQLGGAGSDILSVYDDQIAAVREQQAGIADNVTELERMNAELEKLRHTGERLDLENSINFDPQLRQIEQMVTGLNEMPFDDIIANISVEQAKIAALTPLQAALNAKVDAQKASLAAITWQRDLIKRQLDDEQAKLDQLESAYSDIEALINDMTSSMQEFASASQSAQDALKADAGSLDGVSGNYDIPTGTGTFDTKSSLAGIEEMNKQLEDELAGVLSDMPDPFAMIKDKWKGFVDWFHGTFIADFAGWMGRNLSLEGLSNFGSEIVGFFQRNFSLEGLKNIGGEIIGFFVGVGKTLLNILLWPFKALVNLLRPIWEPVYTVIKAVLGGVAAVFVWLWSVIQPVLMALWNFFYTYIFPVLQMFWAVTKIMYTLIWRLIVFTVEAIVAVLMGLWWVITHVGDIVVWLWQKIIYPAFMAIGAVIAGIYNAIIKPILMALWAFIKNVLGPIFTWLWNNIIKPVWDNISGAIKGAWNATIKPIFDALKTWVQDTLPKAWNVLKDVVSGIWSAIAFGAKNFANDIIKAVNVVIGAFNTLADGVKWVGDKLGIDITINKIEPLGLMKLAKGGIPPVDDNGGLYSGVRAIVGEGSRVWPEYVIPTDPKYRDRAKMLAEAAARRVGLFAKGGTVGKGAEDTRGWFQKTTDALSNLPGMGIVKDAARKAAGLVFEPIKKAAMGLLDAVPNEFLRGFVKKPISMIEDWIKNSDPKIKGDPNSLAGWKGIEGSSAAILAYIKSTQVPYGPIGTFADRNVRGTNRKSLHASNRAVDFFAPHGGVDNDELLAIYRAFLPVKSMLTELIYSGPGGSNPRSAITAADHHNHVHVGLARGGMLAGQQIHNFANGGRFTVPSHPGGMLARIGEGFYNEEVQIKPVKSGDTGGDTLNFYGDLSFPNITDPDDAEKFIKNLKAMADT